MCWLKLVNFRLAAQGTTKWRGEASLREAGSGMASNFPVIFGPNSFN
jgi:hypothetical protein